MNRLKQITTKAKALYKSGKYAKWTDAIKAASKQTATVGATKKKSAKKAAPKKKTAVKKAAPKKKTAVKKAAPKKKEALRNYGSHKDTASHNVRISVVSGIGNLLTHYKDAYGKLSSKKLLEKTKRGKSKIAKEMTKVASKIKKLKNW
jgi:hypothetical protein